MAMGEVKEAFVDATGSGDTAVVAAVAGMRIEVIAAFAVATTAVTAKFRSATTAISPGLPLGANGGFVLPANERGWFRTAQNEALNINLSSGVATGVHVQYRLVQ